MQRVPREEDPQYQPPPLPLEVISSDRVPWIKPPPVEKAGGSGKWGKWVQYENSSTDPPSFYIRKPLLPALQAAVPTSSPPLFFPVHRTLGYAGKCTPAHRSTPQLMRPLLPPIFVLAIG
ncbi:hypothetical protein B0H13DRAFT_2359286 [Mycena leptocephala]|nr:hypothetical protein B0H13DRAFT_2359286 [Mycena leptocephala]